MSSNSVSNHIVIKQIGLLLRGRPILLITRMITDRIGLHSALLPLSPNSDKEVSLYIITTYKFKHSSEEIKVITN